MTLWRRYQADDTGSAAVEAALILPFLIMGGFGVIDASYMLLQNHKMEQGLATAGRYLAQTPDPDNFSTQAKRLATTGQIQSGGQLVIKNWTPNDVALHYKSVNNASNQYRGGANVKVVTLSSELTYQGIGLIKSISGGSIKIKAQYQERMVGDIS